MNTAIDRLKDIAALYEGARPEAETLAVFSDHFYWAILEIDKRLRKLEGNPIWETPEKTGKVSEPIPGDAIPMDSK